MPLNKKPEWVGSQADEHEVRERESGQIIGVERIQLFSANVADVLETVAKKIGLEVKITREGELSDIRKRIYPSSPEVPMGQAEVVLFDRTTTQPYRSEKIHEASKWGIAAAKNIKIVPSR